MDADNIRSNLEKQIEKVKSSLNKGLEQVYSTWQPNTGGPSSIKKWKELKERNPYNSQSQSFPLGYPGTWETRTSSSSSSSSHPLDSFQSRCDEELDKCTEAFKNMNKDSDIQELMNTFITAAYKLLVLSDQNIIYFNFDSIKLYKKVFDKFYKKINTQVFCKLISEQELGAFRAELETLKFVVDDYSYLAEDLMSKSDTLRQILVSTNAIIVDKNVSTE